MSLIATILISNLETVSENTKHFSVVNLPADSPLIETDKACVQKG